jgi:hypothetical protein
VAWFCCQGCIAAVWCRRCCTSASEMNETIHWWTK